ncbi:hypothetical protein [Mesorhizobium amorphae]|uniref:hypothetical protein n=1 Tax=Mesorhizobium amorphae TaxID=71433 RepID=UPI0011859935|nr:hypothetical protein [Mesorhizobium amorphae]
MVAFTGGDKLVAKLAEIAQSVSNASSVEIGFLDGATYPDGTPVPLVAAMNEFGNENSPPRPFFRGMIQAKARNGPMPSAAYSSTTATTRRRHLVRPALPSRASCRARSSNTSVRR